MGNALLRTACFGLLLATRADVDPASPLLKVTLVQGAPARLGARRRRRRRGRPQVDASYRAEPDPLARVEFCARCEDPHVEGSVAEGLTALQGARDYKASLLNACFGTISIGLRARGLRAAEQRGPRAHERRRAPG